jgi:ornithine racemase
MSVLKINRNELIKNISKVDAFVKKYDKKWTLVTKVLAGHKETLSAILKSDIVENLYSVADSRLSCLKVIKEISPNIRTMYIKPPIISSVKNVVRYADISLNSSKKTIEELNKAAKQVGKTHKVILMIELGELREGILKENAVQFYSEIFKLSNIQVIGIGTNLGCMYGVEPTYSKMMQLCLYKELLQLKFKREIDLISAGSSITLPLLKNKNMPKGANHFRIGEAVFLGTSPYDNKKFMNLSTDIFSFYSEIIELEKKSDIPEGNIGDAAIGHTSEEMTPEKLKKRKPKKHYRAILDFGTIEVNAVEDLQSIKKDIKFVGTTSDMTVFDIGDSKGGLSVGDEIRFKPTYMGVARLMSSKYVPKELVDVKAKA